MSKKISDNSKLYITKGTAFFIGTINDTNFHIHHAIQITIGINNNFYIQTENESILTKSIIIKSNLKHKLIGENGIQAVLLLEPKSTFGEIISKYLENNQYRLIDTSKNISEIVKSSINSKELNALTIIKTIFICLGISINTQTNIDFRINKLLNIIDNNYEKKISVNELANSVSISESRLQHIFKNQVGISIKKYLLWKRLIDGIGIITSGKDFTFASHEAGFSDSAHMSRTFKKMFGINLQDIFKNSRSVQVIISNN